MFKSFRIGSILGIPIKLDVTFLLILPIFAWVIAIQVEELIAMLDMMLGTALLEDPQLTEGNMPWILGSIAAIGLFACVLAHELGHSIAAIRYGFPIQSITLWLLGGVAQLTDQPRDWRQELVIAIAGPIVSIGLGVGFWLAVLVIPPHLSAVVFVAAYLALMNIILAAFNMLPGFPMDGGRVLRALLARNQPFAVATAQAARVGKLFAIALGLFGLLAMNFILIAIALFIYIAATGEARYVALQSAVEGITVEDVMTPSGSLDVVTPELSVEDLLELMYTQRHTGYPVIDPNGGVMGIVTLDDVRDIPGPSRGTTRVEDVMTRELMTVAPEDDAIDAIEALQRNDIGRLLVMREGDLAGLITRSDLVTALNIGAVRGVRGRADAVAGQAGSLDRVAAAGGRPRW